MAKTDSLLNLTGTIASLTFVKSRAYGDHVRAKRGTYKKAKLNQGMKEGSARLKEANVPAKLFKDAIDPYRKDLIDGTMWQRLTSLFRRQLKDDGKVDFTRIVGFEIHSRYTFEKFMEVPSVEYRRVNSATLQIDLKYATHPSFTKTKYVDGYQLSVIAIYGDLKKKKSAKTKVFTSPVIDLSAEAMGFQANLEIPRGAETFLLCVKLAGCEKGKVSNTHTTKGIRVIDAANVLKVKK
jgi:hypothetical protein